MEDLVPSTQPSGSFHPSLRERMASYWRREPSPVFHQHFVAQSWRLSNMAAPLIYLGSTKREPTDANGRDIESLVGERAEKK